MELKLEDPKEFFNFCRMSRTIFEKLTSLVGPLMLFVNRTPSLGIPYLYTQGNSYHDLKFGFRVSVPAISILVPETLKAYKSLSREYLKGYKTESEWRDVANAFYTKWNFPMCLSAIASDGSYYYNYKGFNSIILLAVVDADYKFIMVDVGANVRANDAAALNSSDLGDAIKHNLLNFPPNEELPGTDIKVPYVFVSDDAFRLTPRVLKPYSQRQLEEHKIFNYRLSRARRIVENAFAILSNKFQIFMREINLSVDKIELVTLTCCILHNFLRVENGEESSSNPGGLPRNSIRKKKFEFVNFVPFIKRKALT